LTQAAIWLQSTRRTQCIYGRGRDALLKKDCGGWNDSRESFLQRLCPIGGNMPDTFHLAEGTFNLGLLHEIITPLVGCRSWHALLECLRRRAELFAV